MAWNAAVVVVTACVTLVALREGVRITLIHELDQLLREDLREIEIALNEHEDEATLHEQLDRKDAGHAQHKWFASLIGGDGQVRYQSKHAPPASVWAGDGDASARTAGEWRLTAHTVPGGDVVIRVGASLDSIYADVARLDRFVALAACGVLLIAPLCGYWLAGRATRPLARIIETTAGLRPSQLHERLEIRGTHDELDQLSETFNRLLDRIGNYLQERRDFLANSAHELRTPLAAIRSSIEVALAGGRTNEEYEELLADIIEESASLELLVNQLLLLSETETERLKVDKQEVQFDALVEKAMDMFGGVAEFREIQLVCPALPAVVVHGNQQHLRQVIYNLLDNALKFTPAGGRVTVQLESGNHNEAVVFTVRDTGPGIPEHELPHVFDRFFQGHRPRTATAEKRGTGLGLSICQAIVRAHDGTIEVTSKIGEGSCFTVRLPRGRYGDTTPPSSLDHEQRLQRT
ncbi:MAG: HAMP domain-containing histidine kinase [Planctomycetia bacterium]|nr:HAMP domain-containing histidine kinase [Planctomycetia bacterium]